MSAIEMQEYELRGWQYWPNRFSYDPRKQFAVISCIQSKRGDWPLNRALLMYAMGLVLQGWKVRVSLCDAEYELVLNERSVTLLAYCLDEVPNDHGQHGPYYWIDKDFKLVSSQPRETAVA
jgi:hypothetical protein